MAQTRHSVHITGKHLMANKDTTKLIIFSTFAELYNLRTFYDCHYAKKKML